MSGDFFADIHAALAAASTSEEQEIRALYLATARARFTALEAETLRAGEAVKVAENELVRRAKVKDQLTLGGPK